MDTTDIVPSYAVNKKKNTRLQTTCCKSGFYYDDEKQVHRCNICHRWLCAGDCCMEHVDMTEEEIKWYNSN